MKVVTIVAGEPRPAGAGGAGLVGAVLTRDLVVGGERWAKGRRLSAADLDALARGDVGGRGPWASPGGGETPRVVALLVPGPDDVHEDDAAAELATLVCGPGVEARGPVESRIDLHARAAGVVRVRTAALERLDGVDGLAVFSVLDGQPVEGGSLVASAKTGPHLVPRASLERARALAAAGPIVDVRPYRPLRIAAVVKQTLAPAARARFEATVGAKVAGLGCSLAEIVYVADDPAAVEAALRPLVRGPRAVDLVLTAGAASTDPEDPVFVALAAVGGRVTSHGVPAHPGSMLWLGRAGRAAFLGLPTCGAYSRATAADLLLPWLVAGEPATRRTAARLGHGGILSREMRFRFPPYTRELEAPEG